MPSWSSYLPCEVSDGILVVLPHLERGVLAALLVKRLQDVAVYIGGEALDHPFLLLDLLSSVASPHFPSFIHTLHIQIGKYRYMCPWKVFDDKL